MYSQKIINDISKYIENHLTENLTVEILATKAGFSPYHFCRLFSLYTGMPVMEYVRRRRLVSAASEICSGKRIIDVALEYGFDSHGGFTKAFKKVYGYSPNEYKKRTINHRPPSKNPLCSTARNSSIFDPTVRIESRPGFYIAGAVLRTSSELSSIAQSPALWNTTTIDEIENKIYATAMPSDHGEYYISFPVETGLFRLVTCVKIKNPEEIENTLYVDWVPPATYAVFTTPLINGKKENFADSIIETWKFIFDKWLDGSEYMLDSNGLDFEFYDERCHGEGPYSMEIYIPVKKKNKKENYHV